MSTELRLTRQSPRAFLTKSYPTMKKHNPSIPIMLREAQGTSPKVYARYEFGQEKSQSLEGTTAPPEEQPRPSRPVSQSRRAGGQVRGGLGKKYGLTLGTRSERQANRGGRHDTGQERVIAYGRPRRMDTAAGVGRSRGGRGLRRATAAVGRRKVGVSNPTQKSCEYNIS
jgi:hypothetical protein